MHAWGNEIQISTAACGKGIKYVVVSFRATRREATRGEARRGEARRGEMSGGICHARRTELSNERTIAVRSSFERNGTERNATI